MIYPSKKLYYNDYDEPNNDAVIDGGTNCSGTMWV
jgi:hypothetical protein